MGQDASNPQTVSASCHVNDIERESSRPEHSSPRLSPTQKDGTDAKSSATPAITEETSHQNTQPRAVPKLEELTGPTVTPERVALSAKSMHPPRAPLVLRIGVVGHRPDPKKRHDPDVGAMRDICRELLLRIEDTFRGVRKAHVELFTALPPRQDGKPSSGLRLISALAEGADQWVASDAKQLGYELQAVLPFEHSEYEKDFKNQSALDEHRRLRDAATVVFELDGCREREGDSYLAAGRVLLNQSDLLLALWDGKDAQGTGGTGQIVREALQRAIPTLWVNWSAPADWKLLQPAWRLLQQPSDVKGDMKKLLEQRVLELLLPPPAKHGDDKHSRTDLREAYFADRRRAWTLLGGWWNFFRDLLNVKPRRLAVRVPEFISSTQAHWQRDWKKTRKGEPRQHKFPKDIVDWVETNYLSHYAWANQLSVYYGNNYRSSYVWIYVLGAMAVLLALIG